jgi:diguanylate cyclase (GGDEF)-like protein
MQFSIHNCENPALVCTKEGKVLEKNPAAAQLIWLPKTGQHLSDEHKAEVFSEKNTAVFSCELKNSKIFRFSFQKQGQLFYFLSFQPRKKQEQKNELAELRKELQQVKNLIFKDGLTGLWSRNYWHEIIKNFQEQVFYLLLIDLDDFKKYNDSYGHLAGDKLLRKIAKTIQAEIHQKDIAIRYAGDEFLVIVKNGLGVEVAEKIQKKIEARFLPRITVSIGIAFYPKDGKDLLQLFEIADKNLYLSKRDGKNKVHYENKTFADFLL